MGYTPPPTFTAGQVLTAAEQNILGGDIEFLASTSGVTINTAQMSTSTTYTDLGTVGPAVTVTTGENAIVFLVSSVSNATPGQSIFVSCAVSGSTSIAAPAGSNDVDLVQQADGGGETISGFTVVTGLTPGSNTFTMKYKVGGGTGTWGSRTIAVIPLP